MAKILTALSILNSNGVSPVSTKKVAALVVRASCSGASHSSAYRNGFGTCDALLYVIHTLQSSLEGGQEAGLYRSSSVQL